MKRLTPAQESEITTLADLDLQGLRKFWAMRFGPAPKLRSVELLRLMLAWRLQEEALGGLDAPTRQLLARKGRPLPEGQSLGHGAILRRIWQGRVIEAIIEANGFSFEGRRYPSLSAIARKATGTSWNGPRFFGLRQEQADGAR
jgi:hypothetical protein